MYPIVFETHINFFTALTDLDPVEKLSSSFFSKGSMQYAITFMLQISFIFTILKISAGIYDTR